MKVREDSEDANSYFRTYKTHYYNTNDHNGDIGIHLKIHQSYQFYK